MKSQIHLPKTLEELKELSHEQKSKLWARFVSHPYKRQLRALWYYIQCENKGLKIEQKHMTKIRKYMKNPDLCSAKVYRNKYNLTPGVQIIKIFRGVEFKVLVGNKKEFI